MQILTKHYITISYINQPIPVSENKYRKQRKPPENKSFQIYHIIHSSTRYYNHNTKGNQFHPFSSEINLEDKISCFCPPFWVSCHRKEWGKYSNNNTLPLRSQEQRHRQSRDPSPLPQYTRGRPSRPHPCIHPGMWRLLSERRVALRAHTRVFILPKYFVDGQIVITNRLITPEVKGEAYTVSSVVGFSCIFQNFFSPLQCSSPLSLFIMLK